MTFVNGSGDAPAVGFTRLKHCQVCNFSTTLETEYNHHLLTSRHRLNNALQQFVKQREELSKNKNGVVVTCKSSQSQLVEKDKGIVATNVKADVGNLSFEFEIHNESKHVVSILAIDKLHNHNAFKLNDLWAISGGSPVQQTKLDPNAAYLVRVDFTSFGISSYKQPIVFTFAQNIDNKNGPAFSILREVEVNVIGEELQKPIVQEDDISPYKGERWHEVKTTIPGLNLRGQMIRKIRDYSIPKDVTMLLLKNLQWFGEITPEQSKILVTIQTMFQDGAVVSKKNYKEFFRYLLYIDEQEAKNKISMYNMTNVMLKVTKSNKGHLYGELTVPGLAEKRPSVLRGDVIYLRVRTGKKPEDVETTQYQASVEEVCESKIRLYGLDVPFLNRLYVAQNSRDVIPLDVRFTFSRYPVFIQHRALSITNEDPFKMLFPDKDTATNNKPFVKITPNDIKFDNVQVGQNKEQKQAVLSIVQGLNVPAPYIIFGPPGTGKTVTLVESILQVKKLLPESFILVCAPCNSACDYIAEKLLASASCEKTEILRLVSHTRDMETIPKAILEIIRTTDYMPYPDELKKHRIIVSTLITAGRFSQPISGRKVKKFSHVFIDEAGQAAETEALCSISGVLKQYQGDIGRGQLVLAGDPKQLGPICNSSRAEKWGLQVSLLERLMQHSSVYQTNEKGEYNNRFITKLINNFRSHVDILSLPNKLFYDGELVAKSESVKKDPVCYYAFKGQKLGFPVIFHSVMGKEMREGKSPSIFNTMEIQQVIFYISELLTPTNKSVVVKQEDIGVIAPYIRQVYKLKSELKLRHWDGVEVGTTETFQGREKRVIIISCVRSQTNMLQHDKKFKLGFLVNPKRFCVLMTRAQSKMIVIGNPIVLSSNKHFEEFINERKKDGSFIGMEFKPRDDSVTDKLLNKMTNLKIDTKK